MREGLTGIHERLTSFRRKYYLSLFLRGLLLTFCFVFLYFLTASVIEYSLWLSGWARFAIFVLFFLVVSFSFYRFLKEPFLWWLYRKGLGEEESARLIGSYFPSISDRLVNLIQLSRYTSSSLADAGILQKSKQFEGISFSSAIDLRENFKYLKYLMVPLTLILMILVFNRAILTQGTERIVHFNQEFSPAPPFRFEIQNKELNAFFNEDYFLSLKIQGDAVPEAVYLITGKQRLKLETIRSGEFGYTFEKIQQDVPFQFEASGFFSKPYRIKLINRPELTSIRMKLRFPTYLGKKDEDLTNSGNIEIPEGTQVTWSIMTNYTSKASIHFGEEAALFPMQIVDNQVFTYGRDFRNSDLYGIELMNEHSHNKDRINFSILVIKDQYPQIEVDHLKDSVLFKTIFLGGSVKDDYGLTELALNYQVVRAGKATNQKITIPISRGSQQQSFFYQWNLDSLGLKPGDRLDYFLQVWDNDGVNGWKSVKSPGFVFALPGVEELKTNISRAQVSAENKIEQSLSRAKDLRRAMDEAQQKLKGKQVLDWQDKKMLEDLVEQKKGLDQMISDLQKQNDLLEKKKDAFSEQNEKIRDKAEQIQKLMDELLDPEMKKLFEELEKLLKESVDMNDVQKMLDKMKPGNLEKELQRTLELFKQLQLEYKVDQAIREITEQKEAQEKLLEETEKFDRDTPQPVKKEDDDLNKSNSGGDKKDKDQHSEKLPEKGQKESVAGQENEKDKDKMSSDLVQKQTAEDLAKKQQEQMQKFLDFEKKLDEIGKLAEELKNKTDVPSDQEREEVKENQQESKESLGKGNSKKSAKAQKKAIAKMSQMQQQLQAGQNENEMEIDMANLESLRQIVHGMIKLSFDQEALMKDFGSVQQTDPRYIQLSQNQLKIQDDSKVLEDSLLSLAKKDAFLSSVVTKEVGNLNGHLNKATDLIRERRKSNASAEMQLSMTSINNLAIMLNEHYEMMMDAVAKATPSASGKKKGKKGNPSLGQMQKELNQKISELRNGSKTGKQFSEELAKAAAEQERIRRALQEMQEKLKQEGGKAPGGDLPGKMEETEMDLVNKQLTDKTIQRQKEIETRLLEAEKSMREQNQDEERKGESAKDYEKEIPRAFEEYLRLKEKEVELLKTVPPKLFPYYKKEVNEYFKRIGNP